MDNTEYPLSIPFDSLWPMDVLDYSLDNRLGEPNKLSLGTEKTEVQFIGGLAHRTEQHPILDIYINAQISFVVFRVSNQLWLVYQQ